MFSNIKIEELLTRNDMVLIDVRSPSEYKNFTIPGSRNIPIFDDKERAEIGTIYNKVSVEAAQERGLEIFSAKLPQFISEFKKIDSEKTVFCWRGGMRSKTSATVLDLMNIHVFRLEGGIRAYRKWVVNQLEKLEFHPRTYVLDGYTGTGKTSLLKRLKEESYPVLDLEAMANHRGSNFGHIGLEPHNQKTFDSLLIHQLLRMQNTSYILIEAESKRIGKVVLPPFFNKLKEQGIQIFIDMPIEERVANILEDYRPWEHEQECMKAFQKIKSRIHTQVAKEIENNLQKEQFAPAIRLLLEYYYDPFYKHSEELYPEDRKITVHAENEEEALQKLKKLIHFEHQAPGCH
ncbi:tRNA 2-selenouridine(34) synthase MnmH [Bacillaceae bacterium Marseille-Q3522]|nr:tRNA 2-selenouridine(34) synthase MnmH [Bacillaceae bacterium Marseille-Q3522]